MGDHVLLGVLILWDQRLQDDGSNDTMGSWPVWVQPWDERCDDGTMYREHCKTWTVWCIDVNTTCPVLGAGHDACNDASKMGNVCGR